MKFFILIGFVIMQALRASALWGPDWLMSHTLQDGSSVVLRAMKGQDEHDVQLLLRLVQKENFSINLANPTERHLVVTRYSTEDYGAEFHLQLMGYSCIKIHENTAYCVVGAMNAEFKSRGGSLVLMQNVLKSILPETVNSLVLPTPPEAEQSFTRMGFNKLGEDDLFHRKKLKCPNEYCIVSYNLRPTAVG